MAYHSETAKVKDRPEWMKYITGRVADIGAGGDSITEDAYCVDGRPMDGNIVRHDLFLREEDGLFNTVFSSHFLEHVATPFEYLKNWAQFLVPGGHLVLYMPQKDAYKSEDNPEHMLNWSMDEFLFFFRRTMCGEGKDYKGNHLHAYFQLVHHQLDVGDDRYSFIVIAKRI